MQFFRSATNPWGQEVLIGVAWSLLWAAVIAGVAFVVGHAIYVTVTGSAKKAPAPAEPPAAGLPERILRHSVGARAFHWLMTVAMFVLLITAFFPVIGIQFPWVTIHWIAGVGLLALVLYHIVHSTVIQDFRSMLIGKEDIKEGTLGVKRFFKS